MHIIRSFIDGPRPKAWSFLTSYLTHARWKMLIFEGYKIRTYVGEYMGNGVKTTRIKKSGHKIINSIDFCLEETNLYVYKSTRHTFYSV